MSEDYVQMRDSFQRLKQSELEKIESINAQIVNLEQASKRCHEAIDDARPRTNRGKRICPTCDCISMKLFSSYLKPVNTAYGPRDRRMYKYVCEIEDCTCSVEEEG